MGNYRGEGGGGGAVHLGTGFGRLDESSGLLSALGGGDVHVLENPGGEISETLGEGGTGYMIEDGGAGWYPSPGGEGYMRTPTGSGTNAAADAALVPGAMGGAMMGTGTANGTQDNLMNSQAPNSGGAVPGGNGSVQTTNPADQARPVTATQMVAPRIPGYGTGDVPDQGVVSQNGSGAAQGVLGSLGQALDQGLDAAANAIRAAGQGAANVINGIVTGAAEQVYGIIYFGQSIDQDSQMRQMRQQAMMNPSFGMNADINGNTYKPYLSEGTTNGLKAAAEFAAQNSAIAGGGFQFATVKPRANGNSGKLSAELEQATNKNGCKVGDVTCFVAGTEVVLSEDDPSFATSEAIAIGLDEAETIETSWDRGLIWVAGACILVGMLGVSYMERVEKQRRGEESGEDDRERAIDEFLARWKSDDPSMNRRPRTSREPRIFRESDRFTMGESFVIGANRLDS